MADSKIEVGDKAPAFTLKNQDDQNVKLSDFKGRWVVLYFYPKDDTPGCTIEACDFTSGIKGFEKLDAVVLGCSPDSPEMHRKFIAKHKLPFVPEQNRDQYTLAEVFHGKVYKQKARKTMGFHVLRN